MLELNENFQKVLLTQEMKIIGAKLAQAVHDLWAVDRIQDGWKFGPVSVYKISKKYLVMKVSCFIFNEINKPVKKFMIQNDCT